jgi:predicted ATP-dependent protease
MDKVKNLDKRRIKQIIEPLSISINENIYYVDGKCIGSFCDLCIYLSTLEGLTLNEREYFKCNSQLPHNHSQRKKVSKVVNAKIKSSKKFEKILPIKESKTHEQNLLNQIGDLENRFELKRLPEEKSREQFKKPRKKKEVNPGYVYLVKSTIMKEGIAKVGKSSVDNINNRLGSYGKQRTEYRKSFVYNFSRVEDNLIKEFGKKFEKVPDRNEYFIGDIQEMMKVFDLVVLGIN